MLKAISALALVTQLFPPAAPGVNVLDASRRAEGNRKAAAVAIGRVLFATEWPAQVLTVYADGVGSHEVVGLRISGVHFHHALTRAAFAREVAELVRETFAADPRAQEIDLWASVPLAVGKGVVVAGDLAKPAFRTVFTVSTRRGERIAAMLSRMRMASGVYWDLQWVRDFRRTALK